MLIGYKKRLVMIKAIVATGYEKIQTESINRLDRNMSSQQLNEHRIMMIGITLFDQKRRFSTANPLGDTYHQIAKEAAYPKKTIRKKRFIARRIKGFFIIYPFKTEGVI